MRQIPIAILCLVLLAITACGDDDKKSTPTAASGTAAPSVQPTEVKAATPTPASATATPTAALASSPTAAQNEAPMVLWILRDHAGTGVDTVRFETSVETTARVSVFGSPGVPGELPPPQSDTTFSKTHAIGQPLGTTPGAITIEVTDRQGRKGSANLEMGAVIGRQFFGSAPAVAPKISFDGNRNATVTWLNLQAGALNNSVQVFAKKGGCSTAQACQASFEKAFGQDTKTADAGSESHKVAIQFSADKTQDYQVLITAVVATGFGGQPFTMFYQFNVLAAEIK